MLVELCKDRTGLLVDPDAPPPTRWWTPRLQLTGLPSGAGAQGWPPADALRGLLKGRDCSPVTAADIEDDAVTLLSTGEARRAGSMAVSVLHHGFFCWSQKKRYLCPSGCLLPCCVLPLPALLLLCLAPSHPRPPAGLFRSVRVVAKPPSTAAAPAFALLPSGALETVAPLEQVEYVLAPRQLPAIAELSFRADGGLELPFEEALERAKAAAVAAGPGVAGYLCARAVLLEGQPGGVDVAFEGVEGGKPIAVLRPLPKGARGRSGCCVPS